jgi:hypothetical protein
MVLPCSHLDQVRAVIAETDGCEDCLKTGDTWVHLRLGPVSGHVGGCASSKNRHATRHAGDSGHPLVGSIEPGRPGATATSMR